MENPWRRPPCTAACPAGISYRRPLAYRSNRGSPHFMTATPKFDRRALEAWLIEQGLAGIPIADLFDGMCKRLVASGFPLARGHLSFATLHPLQWAMGIVWQGGRVADSGGLAHGFEMQPAWLTSPFRHMLQHRLRRLRRRLAGSNAVLDYPVLEELRDEA